MRPSVESLNSLAQILGRAEPVYAECRSILGCLDDTEPSIKLEPETTPADPAHSMNALRPNKDAASIHQTIVELEPIPRNRIM